MASSRAYSSKMMNDAAMSAVRARANIWRTKPAQNSGAVRHAVLRHCEMSPGKIGAYARFALQGGIQCQNVLSGSIDWVICYALPHARNDCARRCQKVFVLPTETKVIDRTFQWKVLVEGLAVETHPKQKL